MGPRSLSIVLLLQRMGGGPRVVVRTAAFHARVRGSVPGLGGLKKTQNVSSPSTCESQYYGEVACSASDRQGSNFESCVWRTVSSHSSHHPQEVNLQGQPLYYCSRIFAKIFCGRCLVDVIFTFWHIIIFRHYGGLRNFAKCVNASEMLNR